MRNQGNGPLDESWLEVPKVNVETYQLIFKLENALRELIIERLSRVEGSRWHIRRLPEDVRESFRRGITTERSIKWTQLIPHHPIYYVEFPDLKKIIERNDNWRDAFAEIFGRRDVLSAILSEIEPIRNKIAHNRKATPADKEIAYAACIKIAEAIGRGYFGRLLSQCTLAIDIPERLQRLRVEADASLATSLRYDEMAGLSAWESVKEDWWFEEAYLGNPLSDIVAFFELMENYLIQPRARGTGHLIEAWVRINAPVQKHEQAVRQIEHILMGTG